MHVMKLGFDFASADTTITKDFPPGHGQGICKLVKLVMANFAGGAITFTMDVYDSEGVVFTHATIAEGTTLMTDHTFPIVGGGKVVLTATGAAGSALSCYITFYIFTQD